MAKAKRNELAAGIFVIAALAAGVAVLIWLGAAEILQPAQRKAVFYVPAEAGGTGLGVGSVVKVNDAWVGKISRIWFDMPSNRTLYEAKLDVAGLDVHSDASARVSSTLVGGSALVVTCLGSPKAPLASEAAPVEINVAGMEQIMTELASAVSRLNRQLDPSDEKALVSRVQALIAELTAAVGDVRVQLDGQDSKSLVASLLRTSAAIEVVAENLRKQTDVKVDDSTLASIQAAAADLRVVAQALRNETNAQAPGSLLAKAHTSADNVVKTTDDAAGMIANIRPNAEKTVSLVAQYTEKDLGKILQQFSGVVGSMQEIADEFKSITATSKDIIVMNRPRIDEALANLNIMSLNLKAMSAELRRNPWRLLQKPSSKETHDQNVYDSVRAFSEGAAQLDDAIARLAALREASPQGVRPDDPRLIEINQHIQQAFTRFKAVEQSLLQTVQKK